MNIKKVSILEEDVQDKKEARRLKLQAKQQWISARDQKIQQVLQAARECGVSEKQHKELWYRGVQRIVEDDTWM